jgi:acyl carrier protein
MIETKQRLLRCFRAVFPDLSEEELERASQTSLASWDSVNTVTLMTLVEEEFGIQFAPEDIEDLSSFGLFLAELETRVNGN